MRAAGEERHIPPRPRRPGKDRTMSERLLELDLTEMYCQAYAAWPDYLAFLARDGRPICLDTLMLAERLPEMASALFVAGYTTALVDTSPATRQGGRG
jgi:hypothetical protein